MQFYQAPGQSLHQIEPEFAHLLPAGSVPISDEEAQAIIDAKQPEIVIPQVVTMRQARLALLSAGKLSQVDAVIDSLPEPHKSAARIEWDYSSEVQRDRPFVQQIGAALGYTSEQLDHLFLEASKL